MGIWVVSRKRDQFPVSRWFPLLRFELSKERMFQRQLNHEETAAQNMTAWGYVPTSVQDSYLMVQYQQFSSSGFHDFPLAKRSPFPRWKLVFIANERSPMPKNSLKNRCANPQ